ncbi:MAG TPA: PAS domain-containing sensor histidine kinase, partial [Chryseosolibacter sp.]|nr:PAS domain-containing sensor histidine kinase [Chryseosolibacter sp.]
LTTGATNGSVFRWTGRMLSRDQVKWLDFRFKSEKHENGDIISRGVVVEGSGLPSPRKSKYEELLEKLPIGVAIHAQGKVIFANRHAHMVVGATKPGQLVGLNVFDFVHPEDGPRITERVQRVSEGDSVPLIEEKFIRLDGKVIDVETMAFPFEYNGRPASQVIFRDITEKKKNEAQLRRSESLFMQLFQNLPMAVAMLDEGGKVTAINKGFEDMFGYSKEDLLGKNLNDFIVPEGLYDEGIGLNNLIATNKVVTLESVRKHRSGRTVNVILCGVPVLFENKTIGIYGVYVDITDRKKVEEELKVRNAELDNFVYKVSHDLRAPLSSVLGLVNLSGMDGNDDNPTEYIRIIGEKIKALDNFIGDVLSHSKNLKMEVNISQVDLEKIVDQTFTELSYLDGAQHMKRIVKIEGIDFYSDHWRVSEIFRNLVSNAIKYRKTNSEQSEVTIKITVDHLCADINFADNGIGIKDSSLKRIFEMFYRATDQAEGSGIGLYIVKNAVEKLGGQIRVASAPGKGTRFHILLPNRINSIISTSQISGGGK